MVSVWVPVREGLPDEGVKVLVGIPPDRVESAMLRDGYWYDECAGDLLGDAVEGMVTLWRPWPRYPVAGP